MRRRRSPSPILITPSDELEPGECITSLPAWHDNTLELQSQGSTSTRAQEFRSGDWCQPSSQSSRQLTVCYATPPGGTSEAGSALCFQDNDPQPDPKSIETYSEIMEFRTRGDEFYEGKPLMDIGAAARGYAVKLIVRRHDERVLPLVHLPLRGVRCLERDARLRAAGRRRSPHREHQEGRADVVHVAVKGGQHVRGYFEGFARWHGRGLRL